MSRLLILLALVIQFLTAIVALVVLGSAGVLGSAAFVNANDAMLLFIMAALSLFSTFILTFKIWSAARRRKHLEAQLAAYHTAAPVESLPLET